MGRARGGAGEVYVIWMAAFVPAYLTGVVFSSTAVSSLSLSLNRRELRAEGSINRFCGAYGIPGCADASHTILSTMCGYAEPTNDAGLQSDDVIDIACPSA